MKNLEELTNELLRLKTIKENTNREIDTLDNAISIKKRENYNLSIKIAETMAKLEVLRINNA